MKYLNAFLNLIFPSICPICRNKSSNHLFNPLCVDCWRKIERYSGYSCSVCGIPTVSEHASICEQCLKGKPYKKILYYGLYEGALKEAIHQLKFNKVKRLSKPLSLLLSELQIPNADGIVPVPLHNKRLKQREFNQTAIIGRYLSKRLGMPLLLDVLKKIRETSPQTELSSEERSKNVKNAFSASEKVKGLDIILLDDVVTTGATVKECSAALIKAGAKSVTVLALARSAKNT